MVNNKCVHQVIIAIMRLCLEYMVNEDFNPTIAQFTQNKKVRVNRSLLLKSYKYHEPTKLIHIIAKVTGIKHDTPCGLYETLSISETRGFISLAIGVYIYIFYKGR